MIAGEGESGAGRPARALLLLPALSRQGTGAGALSCAMWVSWERGSPTSVEASQHPVVFSYPKDTAMPRAATPPLCPMGTVAIYAQVSLPKSDTRFCLTHPPGCNIWVIPKPIPLHFLLALSLSFALSCLERRCVSVITKPPAQFALVGFAGSARAAPEEGWRRAFLQCSRGCGCGCAWPQSSIQHSGHPRCTAHPSIHVCLSSILIPKSP